MVTRDFLTQYLRLARKGKTLQEIADQLQVPLAHVKYRLRCMRQFGVPLPKHPELKKHATRKLNSIVRKCGQPENNSMRPDA